MKSKLTALYLVLAFSFTPLTSFAQDSSLAVFIRNHGDFEVLYSRAQSTAIGALAGGFIGAAIEEGVRNSSDSDKETLILEHLSNSNCSDKLLENLINKLNTNEQTTIFVERSEIRDFPNVLTLDIKKCGFKVVNTTTSQVASFAELEAKLKIAGEELKDFGEGYYMTSRNHYYWDELMSNPEIIEEEFVIVLQRIGNRVANKYLYRK